MTNENTTDSAASALSAGLGAWILCTERMPEPGNKVLCAIKRHGLKILRYRVAGPAAYKPLEVYWQGEVVSAIGQSFQIGDVTHWMPLPEAPNVEFSGGAPLHGAASAGTKG